MLIAHHRIEYRGEVSQLFICRSVMRGLSSRQIAGQLLSFGPYTPQPGQRYHPHGRPVKGSMLQRTFFATDVVDPYLHRTLVPFAIFARLRVAIPFLLVTARAKRLYFPAREAFFSPYIRFLLSAPPFCLRVQRRVLPRNFAVREIAGTGVGVGEVWTFLNSKRPVLNPVMSASTSMAEGTSSMRPE